MKMQWMAEIRLQPPDFRGVRLGPRIHTGRIERVAVYPPAMAGALIAEIENARDHRGVERPNVIKPETAHAAFDKACHLLGIELRRAPIDPVTTRADVAHPRTRSTASRAVEANRPSRMSFRSFSSVTSRTADQASTVT